MAKGKGDKPARLRVVGSDESPTGPVEICPWDQAAGEPGRWYALFVRFVEMGPGRSVRGLWRVTREEGSNPSKVAKVSSAWHDRASQWRWVERAEAFDVQQAAERRTSWEARRRAIQETHLTALEKTRKKLIKAIAKLAKEDLRWSDALGGLARLIALERSIVEANPEDGPTRGRPSIVTALDIDGLLSEVYGEAVHDRPRPDDEEGEG